MHRRQFGRSLTTVAAVLAAAVAVAGCEGSNLFEGEELVTTEIPLITIDAPTSANTGADIDVSVTATSSVGITSIDLSFVLGFEIDTDTVEFDPPETIAGVDGTLTIPLEAADSLLVIHARAIQVGGRASRPTADTVRINP